MILVVAVLIILNSNNMANETVLRKLREIFEIFREGEHDCRKKQKLDRTSFGKMVLYARCR